MSETCRPTRAPCCRGLRASERFDQNHDVRFEGDGRRYLEHPLKREEKWQNKMAEYKVRKTPC